MRAVTVEAAVYTVSSGIIGITGDQARSRLHKLKAVRVDKKTGSGEYEVVRPVQFKRGEKFGFSGALGKDGRLNDPEAEQIARLEATDQVRAQLGAEYAKRLAALEATLAAKVEAAKVQFMDALLAKLPQDATPAVLKAIAALAPKADEPGKK